MNSTKTICYMPPGRLDWQRETFQEVKSKHLSW